MGYYVSLEDANAVIPANRLDEALWRLKRINEPDFNHLKTGGSSTGEVWFSWMPPSFDEFGTAADILRYSGFDVDVDTSTGDLTLLAYESKTGCEQTFIQTLCDLFVPGGYVVWKGEDSETWRFDFTGGDMIESRAEIKWVPIDSNVSPYVRMTDPIVIEEAL